MYSNVDKTCIKKVKYGHREKENDTGMSITLHIDTTCFVL